MYHAHSLQIRFDFLPEVEIRAAFNGGAVTSDAGLRLVAQLEEEVGLLRSLAANQFRLMLSMAAYLLLILLRGRAGAEDLRRAQAGTLRLRLIKLGARVTETARSVKLSLAGNYPRARDWIGLAGALGAVIG
ncbi:MAG: hypothetical protein GX134_07000 [candidate division WS1 bacterium]|jgi:hypothetical protein|nr:hypothetical protein [candidate division WS1 bacterium]